MNFAKLATEIVGGVTAAAEVADQAVTSFKADKNNTQKAVTVAQSLLAFLEELAKIGL